MSDDEVSGGEEESLALRRTRRTRGGAKGKDKLAAFEKLRNLKGSKNKYEVREVENVYDMVDEDTYAKKVNDRLKDDWIVDDGTGYTDTGHELFDDDINEGEESAASSRKRANKTKKDKSTKEEKDSQKAGFLSVRDMLSTMPVKRKRNEVAENSTASGADGGDETDDLLDGLLQELQEKKPRTSLLSGQSLLERTKAAERLVSSGRIQEEKKPFASPRMPKKKLPVFQVKHEPVDPEDTIAEDHRSFYGGGHSSTDFGNDEGITASEIIDEFSDDFDVIPDENAGAGRVATSKTVSPEKKPLVEPVQELQLQEVEDFETYRQVDLTKDEPVVSADSKVDFVTEGKTDSEKVLNFYWFDIYEEPRNPGFLYVFGKVKAPGKVNPGGNPYSSCCVVLKNVERCMYLLPREKFKSDDSKDVAFKDIQNEFEDEVSPRFKITTFKVKRTEKKYCFGESNVPAFSEYMEVRYPGDLPMLPEDIDGDTFSRAFGTSSALLENVLLEKKLKGPSWLHIRNPTQVEPGQQQSWCKIEFVCDVKDIAINPDTNKLPIPPFVAASLTMNSVNDASAKRDTIICLNAQINKSFNIQSSISQGVFHESFSLINKPPGEIWPFDVGRVLDKNTQKMESERQMLNCFLAKMQVYDPDIYIGHDINFEFLLLQLWNHKVPHWSRIGRLKRSSQPQKGSRMPDSKAALAGRLVCDVKVSAMELIRARSYDLPNLCVQVLNKKEDQILIYNGNEMRQLFESSDGIKHLLMWGMSLSSLNLQLVNELQVMPLALQITSIAGNTLSRTLSGGRSERNECLLLHAFYNKGYIVPDKKKLGKRFKEEPEDDNGTATKDEKGTSEGKSKTGGPSYLGGLVLDPKKGFYDNFIVLMDFNSLYPSIIQEYNVCFTTSTTDDTTDESEKGILPEEIRKLVESRKQVKQLMKVENLPVELKKQYDIRQKALKLTANSMYGCLGFKNSRFYAKRLAALITGKGREILLKTKDTVEKMGFEVIYGDTDSLMINTNTTDIKVVFQIGNKIKAEINRTYKLLELEIDGVFRFLLLLKKKKYAALLYEQNPTGEIKTTLELKGLDMVRRDWAPVAAQTARSILDEIMTEQPLDDKIFKTVKILNDKAAELRAGSVPMKELLITKQLAKNPEEYKDGKGLHHVLVALRMNASGKLPKKFKNGDTVPYLFCTDGIAHHPAELMSSKVKKEEKKESIAGSSKVETDAGVAKTDEDVPALEPDVTYYLSNQIHPVVSRICEPIPGLDAARIAESLGLDSSSYKRRRVYENHVEEVALGEVSDAEKFRECKKFSFLCANPDCKKENIIDSPYVEKDGKVTYSLVTCSGGCDSSPLSYLKHISNTLTLFMRKWIDEYSKGWYECEDPSCTNTERAVPLHLERGYLVCPCKQGVMIKKYTHADLNKQLNYLLYIFDYEKRASEFEKLSASVEFNKLIKENAEKAYDELTRIVNHQLSKSSYSLIQLSDLFNELMPVRKFAFGKQELV